MRKILLFFITLLNAWSLNIEGNYTAETNKTFQTVQNIEVFNDTYFCINNKTDIAVVIDKKRFFKYIPSLINALNAYFAQKGIDYQISLYNTDVNLSSITSNDIIYFTTDANELNKLKDYNKTFYFPLINKKETNIITNNFYFGSIDFQKQLHILSSYINNKTYVIADKTIISKKLLNCEKQLKYLRHIYTYPNIYYRALRNSFILFNTSAGKTAQVLSKITQKEIYTRLKLIPQIGYDPLMIILTQPRDIAKLLIANSIIHPPLIINENATLLNSDIRYNWMNFATCILANKIYNKQNYEDEFYMSDFNIYIFDNQIEYKIKLYRIISGAFKKVE